MIDNSVLLEIRKKDKTIIRCSSRKTEDCKWFCFVTPIDYSTVVRGHGGLVIRNTRAFDSLAFHARVIDIQLLAKTRKLDLHVNVLISLWCNRWLHS